MTLGRRILFVDQYGGLGGGQTVLLSLLKAAQSLDASITVLAPGGGALQQAVEARFGSTVTFIPCPELHLAHGRKTLGDVAASLAYGWRFRRYLPMLRRQDIVYLNGPRHLPHFLFYSLRISARMLCHLHLDHAPLEKKLMRLATRWFNPFQLVANSRFVLEAIRTPPGSTVLVENALDEVFEGLPFQNRFDHAGQPWRAAVIGTMRPEKGQDIALAAFAERPDITLHLIGCEGDGAAAWVRGLKSAATKNVRFEGATIDVAGTMQRLGIQFSLVPSRWPEPFGLVAIESMASSCITIVSGRGGLGEIAKRTGALVADDAQELGLALDRLVSLPAAELQALARRQYETVQRHYASTRFQQQVCQLLSTAFRGQSIRLS